MDKSLQQFFEMGGYGAFVWSAYGIAVLILVGLIVVSKRHQRQVYQKISRMIQL